MLHKKCSGALYIVTKVMLIGLCEDVVESALVVWLSAWLQLEHLNLLGKRNQWHCRADWQW